MRFVVFMLVLGLGFPIPVDAHVVVAQDEMSLKLSSRLFTSSTIWLRKKKSEDIIVAIGFYTNGRQHQQYKCTGYADFQKSPVLIVRYDWAGISKNAHYLLKFYKLNEQKKLVPIKANDAVYWKILDTTMIWFTPSAIASSYEPLNFRHTMTENEYILCLAGGITILALAGIISCSITKLLEIYRHTLPNKQPPKDSKSCNEQQVVVINEDNDIQRFDTKKNDDAQAAITVLERKIYQAQQEKETLIKQLDATRILLNEKKQQLEDELNSMLIGPEGKDYIVECSEEDEKQKAQMLRIPELEAEAVCLENAIESRNVQITDLQEQICDPVNIQQVPDKLSTFSIDYMNQPGLILNWQILSDEIETLKQRNADKEIIQAKEKILQKIDRQLHEIERRTMIPLTSVTLGLQ